MAESEGGINWGSGVYRRMGCGVAMARTKLGVILVPSFYTTVRKKGHEECLYRAPPALLA